MITHLPRQFKTYLQQLGYSDSTCRMLPACISEFIQYGQFMVLQTITPAHIQDFYQWLHVRPLKRREGALSEVMIGHYVYGLKVFFNWLEVTGRIKYNPISGLKFRRPGCHGRHPLTALQIATLFAAAVSYKEQAMLHLFYSCGLRRSEAAALRLNDVHIKQRLLYVRAGKGAKRRVIPLTARVAASLEAYVRKERNAGRQDTKAFMLNRIGSAMSGNSYNRLLKSLVQRAGLPGDITLHHLRHSIATHLLQGGMSLEYVRDFLGHTHLEATQLYAKVSGRQLQQL